MVFFVASNCAVVAESSYRSAIRVRVTTFRLAPFSASAAAAMATVVRQGVTSTSNRHRLDGAIVLGVSAMTLHRAGTHPTGAR